MTCLNHSTIKKWIRSMTGSNHSIIINLKKRLVQVFLHPLIKLNETIYHWLHVWEESFQQLGVEVSCIVSALQKLLYTRYIVCIRTKDWMDVAVHFAMLYFPWYSVWTNPKCFAIIKVLSSFKISNYGSVF